MLSPWSPPATESAGRAVQPRAEDILAALPQTQCTRCGYPDCAGYAQAIVEQDVPVNRCPPGGAEGIARLSALTGRAVVPLNPAYGTEAPRQMAFIDEAWCIGCTLCLKACPVDAIIGSHKRMHTVLEMHCTGCELCLPVCPVDCIHLEPASGTRTGWAAWSSEQADQAHKRYARRRLRDDTAAAQPAAVSPNAAVQAIDDSTAARRAVVEAAMARARARRGA